MTAAYRLKGFGWFVGLAAVALCLYLISLQVAAERKRLDDVNGRIALAQRDIRALETEFDTRANMRQLERWNGDTLALAAPTAAQFVSDDAALAALDPTMPTQPVGIALVVPAIGAPAAPQTLTASAATARPGAAPTLQRAAPAVAPDTHAGPAMARLAEAARGIPAATRARPQTVALLDRQLLSDATVGTIATGARREARR